MLVDKNELLKLLRVLNSFDSPANAYIGVQFDKVFDKPLFYRQSVNGFVQSKEYDPNAPATYVSLSHLLDILRVVNDEKLEMYTDNRGVLRLDSLHPDYPTRLAVHTVTKDQTGMKTHVLGVPRRVTLDPASFASLDIKPFHQYIGGQPTLREGKLMVETKTGILMWQGPDSLKNAPISPKEAFLRMIAGQKLEDLVISERGYWTATGANMLVSIMGHHGNQPLFSDYDQPGEVLATITADRLCYAMKLASNLCGDTNKVEIDPKKGVVFKDEYGDPSVAEIGHFDTFHKFSIFGTTAKMIVDALSQTDEADAVLLKVSTSGTETMRFKRGSFEVNVKVI